jgi:hypothetical protein
MLVSDFNIFLLNYYIIILNNFLKNKKFFMFEKFKKKIVGKIKKKINFFDHLTTCQLTSWHLSTTKLTLQQLPNCSPDLVCLHGWPTGKLTSTSQLVTHTSINIH